jgi:hypothetical protein
MGSMRGIRLRIEQASLYLLALALLWSSAHAAPVTRELAPGVWLTQEVITEPAPLIVNAVMVDVADPSVSVKAAIGQDTVYTDDSLKGREKISTLAARKGALVGINSDFFPFGEVPTGDPLNVCVIDGELISEPAGNRAVMGVLSNRTVFFDTPRLDAKLTFASGVSRQIDGINRVRGTNQVIVYTAACGPTTQNKFKATDLVCASDDLPVRVGKPIKLTITEVKPDAINTPIPKHGVVISGGGPAASFLSANARVGDVVTVQFDIKSASCYDWTMVDQAVGGGPWILKDGKEFIDLEAEGMTASFSKTKHPRTAVGTTAEGKLLLVTVDGRQTISEGISLPDLSALMRRLGCVNAINLDGGGSTTLAIKGLIANSVSGSDERAVANGLLVFAPQAECADVRKLAISGLTYDVPAGQGVQLRLVCGDDAAPLTEEQMKSVVWGASGAVGFVSQSGYFVPLRAKQGKIRATLGSQLAELDVTVVPGPPAEVRATLAQDKADPARSVLTVTATDANANKITNKDVILNTIGGKADVETGAIDGKGEFTTGVTWDPAATDRRIVVVVGEASAEVKGPAPKSVTAPQPVPAPVPQGVAQ